MPEPNSDPVGGGSPGAKDAVLKLAGLEPELGRRHDNLLADLRELESDALVATREGVVTYLTGYTTRTWSNFSRPIIAVLFADRSLAVLCADTEAQAVESRVPGVEAIPYGGLAPVEPGARLPDGRVQFMPGAGRALEKLLRERGVGRIAADGLAAIHPPISQVTDWLGDWPGGIADASSHVWARRLSKSDWEVAQLTRVARVLEQAFELLPERLEAGHSERELHGALAAASFEAGADELGYTNVVTVGRGREIFGSPTDKTWQPGEVLYVDGGVIVNGYWADFCRQYTLGEPTAEQAAGYERAVAARDASLAAFWSGMPAGELGRVIEESTDTPASAHQAGRYGHGIGLYMPEPPSIAAVDSTPLVEGTALCLEPAVLHDGTHYVVEEEYVVREGRLTPITQPAPRALIAL
jgi:Xaa-Pro aminopeptidase